MLTLQRLLPLVLAFTVASAAHAQTRIRFTLDWKFEGQTSYMWLGLQRGYFQQEGLDVQVDAGVGSTAAIQRIHTGAYDMGLGDMSALIEYFGNFPGQQRVEMVYMQYDEAPLAFYALKKSGAKSIADLAGKNVIGAVFDVNRKLFPIIAKAANINPNSVTWVTVDPALRTTAVIQGTAFATGGFYYAPLEFEARGLKRDEIVEMKISALGVRLYGNGVMASTQLITENPKAVAGFVRAFNRAFRETLADPEAAVKALKVREPLVDVKMELERLTMVMPAMLTQRTRANGLGGVETGVLEKQIEDVAAVFTLKAVPKAEQMFNPKFLPPRSERMPLK